MNIEFDKEKSRGFYLHDKTNQSFKNVSSEAKENEKDSQKRDYEEKLLQLRKVSNAIFHVFIVLCNFIERTY